MPYNPTSHLPRNEEEMKIIFGQKMEKLLLKIEAPFYNPIDRMKNGEPPFDDDNFYQTASDYIDLKFKSRYGYIIALMSSFKFFYIMNFYEKEKNIPSLEPSLQELLNYRQMEGDLTLKSLNPNMTFNIINLPPGIGKSAMSAAFVAWTAFREVRSNYIYLSGNETVLNNALKDISSIIDSFCSKDTTISLKTNAISTRQLVINQSSGGSNGNIYGFTVGADFIGNNGNAMNIYNENAPVTKPHAVRTVKGRKYQKHFSGFVSVDDPNTVGDAQLVMKKTYDYLSRGTKTRIRDKSTSHTTIIQQVIGPYDATHNFLEDSSDSNLMRYAVPLINRFGFSNFEERRPIESLLDDWKQADITSNFVIKSGFFYEQQQYIGELSGTTSILHTGQEHFIQESFGLGSDIRNCDIVRKLIVVDPAGTAYEGQDKPCIGVLSIIDYSTQNDDGDDIVQYRLVLDKVIYTRLNSHELPLRIVEEYKECLEQHSNVKTTIVIEGGNASGNEIIRAVSTQIISRITSNFTAIKNTDIKHSNISDTRHVDLIEFLPNSIKQDTLNSTQKDASNAKVIKFQLAFDKLFTKSLVKKKTKFSIDDEKVSIFYGRYDAITEFDSYNPDKPILSNFYGTTCGIGSNNESTKLTALELLLTQLTELKNSKRPDDFADVISIAGIIFSSMSEYSKITYKNNKDDDSLTSSFRNKKYGAF